MFSRVVVSAVLFVAICGCATTYPKDPESQVYYWIRLADDSIAKGEIDQTGHFITSALEIPVASEKIRDYLAKNRSGLEIFRKYILQKVDGVSSIQNADSLLVVLRRIQLAEIFPKEESAEFIAQLNKNVVAGNLSGTVEVLLSDRLENFPVLKSPEHTKVIVSRTIRYLQETRTGRLATIQALLDYVKKSGVLSAEGRHVESLLPTLNIRADEIAYVANVFPAYAKARREEIYGKAVLQFKNIDRLSADDLTQAIKQKVKGIDWVSVPDKTTSVLVIERVRNDEKVLPESTRTITYAQHQVNLLGAALLMPRNASYMYDLITGGAEIDYGYVLTVFIDAKKVSEDVIRGKVGGENRRCQNARIQNVFGGISPAEFVANDDMVIACSGSQAISIDGLRREVLDKVAGGVLNVSSIKKMHDLH